MNEKTARPLVSVVIPHYGGIEVISECIASLNNCIYFNIEIIVVDNNSPDNSHEFIKTKFPEIKTPLTKGKLKSASANLECSLHSSLDRNSTDSPLSINITSATNLIVAGLGVISA